MKGFILDKNDEDYLKNNALKGISREVIKEDKFDNITIANPINSNRIYIINNIYVQSDNEEFQLRIGQSVNKGCYIEESEKFLCFKEINEGDEYIHVTSIQKGDRKVVELLEKRCLILLPQGYLNIKVDKPINKIKIKIYWEEENIQ